MKIIVVEEKHATYYLDASDLEAWKNNSWQLLKKRFEEGYWYLEDDPNYVVIKAEVENGPTTAWIGRPGTRYHREVPVAWHLLDVRSDYEYENVSLESVINLHEMH